MPPLPAVRDGRIGEGACLARVITHLAGDGGRWHEAVDRLVVFLLHAMGDAQSGKDGRLNEAIANLAGVLAPGGVMAHVVPCRNAPFAILNRALGNRLARRVLFAIFPEKERNSGFPAYYRGCTPGTLTRLCRENGLQVVQVNTYYNSDYTSFFAPLYTIEMLRQVVTCRLGLEEMCEVFSIVARAPGGGQARQTL